MLERPRGPSLEQPAQLRESLDSLLVARAQGVGERFQTFAEGAETDNEETCPRLAAHAGEGREEAMDALGVDQLAHVNYQRRVGNDKGLEPVAGISVVGAGVVGVSDTAERFQLLIGVCRTG